MSDWRRRWFPKKLLEWREPAEFRGLVLAAQARVRSRTARLRWTALTFALLFAPILGRWAVNDLPASRLLVGAVVYCGLAFLLVYAFAPWMERRPSSVAVWETGISRSGGNTVRFWRFSDLERLSWLHRPDFSVLALRPRSGREVYLGVPPGETPTAVDALLRERGLVLPVDDADLPLHFSRTSRT